MQALPIEKVTALYFDKEALREPAYRLFRINTPKGRYYYTFENDEPVLYMGVTTMLGMVIPKAEGLIKWIADMGYEESRRYMMERAYYGTLLHIQIADFLINGSYTFSDVPSIVDAYIEKEGIVANRDQYIVDIQKDMLAFCQFAYDYKVKPIAIEIMLVHPDGYSGTIDLIAYMEVPVKGFWGETYKSGERKGEPKESTKSIRMLTVIDIKSTRKSTAHEEKDVQLEAYKQLIEHNFPDLQIQRLYNWSPKDWRETPSYNLNDKTDSVDMNKFYAWIRVAQIETEKKDNVFAEITGTATLGVDPSTLYAVKDVKEYIRTVHAKRMEAYAEDSTIA